jgi:Ti-type conjugative transfer relaxase TraA
MLSISPPMKGAGQGDYYLDLAQEDYYTKGGEPPGKWYGEDTESLGVEGQVQAEDLRKLLEGYSPDGKEKLVQNAGDENRQSGWDLTFSAPKSVSTLWAVSDEETRKVIQQAQEKAVHAALDHIQDEAGFTRRGKGGEEIESAKLSFATFEHGTSRAQDPQLHTHVLALNIGIREDGTTGTIRSKDIFEQKMSAGAIYRAELSYQLEQSLGLDSERDKSFFQLTGVPKDLQDEFSTRRKEIEEALEKSGYSGAVAAKVATLETRGLKGHTPREELFEQWKGVAQEHGFTQEKAKDLHGQAPDRDRKAELNGAVTEATAQITDKESYFSKQSLVRYAAENAQGRGLSAKEVKNGVTEYLSNSPEIVKLGDRDGKTYYTTKEILEHEEKILKTSHDRKGENLTVGSKHVEAAIANRPTMLEEQKDAVRHITQKEGATQIVTGFAGTGKSYMLEAAKEAYQADGYKVFGAAPSGVAAKGLENDTGIKSETIHRTLMDLERGNMTLDKKSVLIVDEAGMVSTKLMSRLVDETSKSGAKLVLVGDERQIQSVQAGGALKSLKEELGFSELKDIRRQSEDWAKGAVKSFAEGDAQKALKAYNDKGLVTVSDTPNEARDALISSWKKDGITAPKDNIIIASTNLDVSILNEKAQSARFGAKELKGDAFQLKGKSYFEGDRVLFTQNSKWDGVANGNLGTITGFDRQNKAIKVKLDSGKDVKINTEKYDQIKLGYAITAHKSQGGTFKNAYLHIGSNGLEDREISYVKASRAKESTRFFLDKDVAGVGLKDIGQKMTKSHMKELATSFAEKVGKTIEGLGLGK